MLSLLLICIPLSCLNDEQYRVHPGIIFIYFFFTVETAAQKAKGETIQPDSRSHWQKPYRKQHAHTLLGRLGHKRHFDLISHHQRCSTCRKTTWSAQAMVNIPLMEAESEQEERGTTGRQKDQLQWCIPDCILNSTVFSANVDIFALGVIVLKNIYIFQVLLILFFI